MKFKHKLKTLVAAVAVAVAGNASAALTFPATGDGSLVFTLWDSSVPRSYSLNLGYTLDTFVTTSSYEWNLASRPLFTSTFGTPNLSTYQWTVTGGDATINLTALNGEGQRVYTTASGTGTGNPFTAGVTNNSAANGASQIGTVIYPLLNAGSCLGGANTECVVTTTSSAAFGGNSNYGQNLGGQLPFLGGRTGAGTLKFFNIYSNDNDSTDPGEILKFTYAGGDSYFELFSDGKLCYNGCSVSAVPVPAAVWLFGSGLFGLVGVARRRRGKSELESRLALA